MVFETVETPFESGAMAALDNLAVRQLSHARFRPNGQDWEMAPELIPPKPPRAVV